MMGASMRAGEVSRVGVVGAGTMGSGIAHVFALAGIEVRLVDVAPEALGRARASIERDLARQTRRERISTEEAEAALDRVTTERSLTALEDAEVVVEAASEDPTLKFRLFEELSAVVSPETLLASNTSSISITLIASHAADPGRVIGMHFMNPVPVMRLVEVIRGLETTDDTADLTLGLCARLSKTAVLVNDYPGFVANRILMPMINEAVYCLMEGVAEAEAVDTVMKLGMNHPMGPLALADLIGLDTCLAIMLILHEEIDDTNNRPIQKKSHYIPTPPKPTP
ncbi:MAG: 3-hydroxybutyryl-CoA dehydrogenase, partial [Gemmatimonadales bacterium]|nr:3-hydroxybutyryl-CoA dehydrogenase [Gemmatimonadales bacterium]